MKAALRYPAFRRLALGLAGSQIGDWLYNVALLAFVYERTHSGAWLGATTAARLLPIVLLAPLGGVLVDRYDRRRLMIVSDLVRAGLMVALALAAALDLPIIAAPLLAGLATAAGAAYPAATAASLPRLVPAADLGAANAVRGLIGPVCIVTGPVLGSAVLAVAGASAAFVVNALTFVGSAIAVWSIGAGPAFRPVDSGAAPHLWRELREGAAALFAHRDAMRLVGADVLGSFVYGVLTVALLFVGMRIGMPAGGYGLLLGATGAGGVLGAALASRVASRPQPLLALVGGLLAVALPLPLLASTSWLIPALALAAVGGVGAMIVEVLTETVLQRSLDEAVLARAYGFAFPVSIGGICVGGAVAAPLITALGLVATLALVCAIVAAYAVWLAAGARVPRVAIA